MDKLPVKVLLPLGSALDADMTVVNDPQNRTVLVRLTTTTLPKPTIVVMEPEVAIVLSRELARAYASNGE